MSEYTAVFHCSSAIHFEQSTQFPSISCSTPSGMVQLYFATVYKNVVDQLFPYALIVQARGTAPSLPDARRYLGGVVREFTPYFAVSTNAAIGDLRMAVVFDSTSGRTEREYFQNRVPLDDSLPRQTRQVPIEATLAMMNGIMPHPDHHRLHRAAEHYSVALEHWQAGRELPILSHLWMCVETLTDVAVRQQCRDNNFPTSSAGIKQLAVLFGVDPEKPGELRSKVRETYLFQGNPQVYSDARKLRNAIVHGFEDFDAIRTKAHPICEATAAYLRTAVFRLAGLAPAMQQTLLNAPYHQPLGSWPVAQHVWGKLEGRSETLAPEHSFFHTSNGTLSFSQLPRMTKVSTPMLVLLR